jgi:hypothetical protein
LIEVYGATRVSTRQWMQANRQIPDDRHALNWLAMGLIVRPVVLGSPMRR